LIYTEVNVIKKSLGFIIDFYNENKMFNEVKVVRNPLVLS